MDKPRIAGNRPQAVELKAGDEVWWCACGLSKRQPFCDGSHEGTAFRPQRFRADRDDKYFFCLCKRTGRGPLCDGSHKSISQAELDEQAGLRTVWHKVAGVGDLQEGEVRTVQAGGRSLALVKHEGRHCALDNACPHQGGPLGEGSIEDGWLRCPWHGWDFHPCTGRVRSGAGAGVATLDIEERDDGVYVGVKEHAVRPRTLSDLMVETLVNWGVTHVFGMVGHSNLGLADAIRVQEEAGRLSYIGIRHEGAAAFAASGYAKLSGQPAACLSIAGPGATNLITGLWDARVDRAPVIALTGQVQSQVLGPGAFQEIDLAAAFKAVAVFSQTVLRDSRHAELMNLACKNAMVNRDVAHLIFPDEVQTLAPGEGVRPGSPEGRLSEPEIVPSRRVLDRALERLTTSRRPIVIVGYGARNAMADILALAERLGAPVLTTFKAKGQIPDDHPLAAGVLGRSGTPVASWLMNESDLILVFGASFSNHTGIAPNKPTIQVDFDRMALGKFHPVEVPVWGEIGVTARLLNDGLLPAGAWQDQRRDVAERWGIWRQEKAARRARDLGRGLNSAMIFDVLGRACPEDAVIAVDVGNNTYSFGRYFECRRQRVLMSGYLGSIGFSFPAAIGAWAATQVIPELKGRTVLSVSGDGGFGQYLGEFTTAVKYGMDITHVLLNNGELGKISKEQRAGNWPVWQTDLHNPDFGEYARLCGGWGRRVVSAGELEEALEEALAYQGPALVEIVADRDLI